MTEYIFAKKSLGQNFLKSKAAVGEIIKAATLTAEDTVLEVGPGKGVLTESLLASGAKVIVVEKDDRLVPFLEEKFSKEIRDGKLHVIHQDILEFKPEEQGLKAGEYKVIANIPYYITGQLLRQFLESDTQPSKMVLMLQKEVAKRIVARDNKESILSLSVKAYGTPKYIKTVPAKYFAPAPKVDSAILLIDHISKDNFTSYSIEERRFFELVKSGFAHKRKVLIRNLEEVLKSENLKDLFMRSDIDPKARAEDIPLEKWLGLAKNN